MGFHPETGDELLPITKDKADLWKRMQQISHKPPKQVNPEEYSFYDSSTGEPRVWYWRSKTGDYEFYDNQGFHPRTGEPLLVITHDIIAKWKQENDAASQRKRDEQLKRDCEAQERSRKDEQKSRETLVEQEGVRQATYRCDQLAANPSDKRKAAAGVPYDQLKMQSREAIEACSIAVSQYPSELRFQYQLGRALEFEDRPQALSIHTKLVSLGYPAAFDNLGSLILSDQRDFRRAERIFREGVRRGDADSMVSLANMI